MERNNVLDSCCGGAHQDIEMVQLHRGVCETSET